MAGNEGESKKFDPPVTKEEAITAVSEFIRTQSRIAYEGGKREISGIHFALLERIASGGLPFKQEMLNGKVGSIVQEARRKAEEMRK